MPSDAKYMWWLDETIYYERALWLDKAVCYDYKLWFGIKSLKDFGGGVIGRALRCYEYAEWNESLIGCFRITKFIYWLLHTVNHVRVSQNG